MDWSHVGDVLREKRVLRLGRVHCLGLLIILVRDQQVVLGDGGNVVCLGGGFGFQDSVSSSPWDMKDSKILHFSTSTRTAQTSHKRIGLLQWFGPKMQVVLALVLVTKSSNGPKKTFITRNDAQFTGFNGLDMHTLPSVVLIRVFLWYLQTEVV